MDLIPTIHHDKVTQYSHCSIHQPRRRFEMLTELVYLLVLCSSARVYVTS